MSIYDIPNDRVTYNYRYFLPHAPEWGSEELCNRRLTELLEFCQEAKVDAVQFYVNIRPGTYYMPPSSADGQEHWAEWMKDVVSPALRSIGVSYQLNFQMILGASTWGLDMRDEYDWEFMVSQYGEETLGCPCPLSPVFRERMSRMLRLWAATEPDIFWIDDDFRMHNHGGSSTDMDSYCYCNRHLQEFAKIEQKSYSREELVAEILKPGKPSRLRSAWMDFIGSTMVDFAGWIRKEVNAVSPDTRMALMTSAPDVHSGEGRDWKALLTSLCGDRTPITRPCSGIYSGTSVPVKNQSLTFRFMAQSIAVVEQAFGPYKVDYGPELENTRFTTWCKSRSNMEFVMILGQLLGCPHITMSLNDLDGSPINDEPSILATLRENKPRLQTLAQMQLRHWKQLGVAFLSDPESARKVELGPDAKIQSLGLIREMEDALLQVGVPARYVSPAQAAARNNDVTILEAYTAWCPSDEEMKRILSGAVLMDGGAADVLQRRGFGELLGVSVSEPQFYGISSEKYVGDVLPGVEFGRIPHRGMKWYDMELNGATLASQFIDSKNRCHVGSTVYENGLGGRVAVYAGIGDMSPYGTFGNHARLRWLHGVLRWISREHFDVLPVIPHHGLTVVRSKENETLIAFANLGTDVLRELKFRVRIAHHMEKVAVLSESGEWEQVSCLCEPTDVSATHLLSVPCDLGVFEWLIVSLNGVNNSDD